MVGPCMGKLVFLLGGVVAILLAGASWVGLELFDAEPAPLVAGTPSATPCPPATTPERYMQAESQQVQAALAGLDALIVRVSATGIQHCPGLPAEEVAWFSVDITVNELPDDAALVQIVERVAAAVAAYWPETPVWLTVHTPGRDAERYSYTFTARELDTLRSQGVTGRALLEALNH
jgi:hypothetical protein